MPPTQNLLRIVHHMARTGGDHYAYGLQQATGVTASSAYYVLRQLERAGHAISHLESENVSDPSKPPRQWYELTEQGQRYAQTLPDPDPTPMFGGLHAT